MIRLPPLTAVTLLLAACAGGSGSSATPVAWTPGRYQLEATISYVSARANRSERRMAELVIEPDGTMRLTDTTGGICQDPSAAQSGADQASGRRTFYCPEARYELRPVANSVVGELLAEVTEEIIETVCVRFEVNAAGQRVCVQTEDRITPRQVVKRARLQVISM
jgi:hypothetical protein